MRAIVTGANGFVGAALVKKLIENNVEVLAIDLSFEKSRLPENPLIELLELSIADIAKLEVADCIDKYDLFYHFAWVGSAGPLRMDEKIQTQNALWTVECLKVAAKLNCKKFICAGSIMEYEVINTVYAQETKPGMPNLYSAGKVLAHQLAKPIANNLNIDLVWAYITNAYGVGEMSPRFINSTLRKIIHGENLEFTSGIQNYDFVYIDDVANAFYLLGIYGKANKGYMIGSGNAKPLKDFIIEMCNTFPEAKQPLFGNVPYTGVNLPIDIYSIEELVSDCGYSQTISFVEGVIKTKEWLETIDNEY